MYYANPGWYVSIEGYYGGFYAHRYGLPANNFDAVNGVVEFNEILAAYRY